MTDTETETEYVCGVDRFTVLHYNAIQRQLKRQEVLAQIEDFEQQVFYKPRITKKAYELAAKSPQRAGSPELAFDRLHNEAEVRKVVRQVKQKEAIRNTCPFQPVVNPRSRSPSPDRRSDRRAGVEDLPFPERLHPSEEEQRDRWIRLEHIRAQEEVKGCTFKPHVNPPLRHSEETQGTWEGGPSVHERLNKYHEAQQMRLAMLRRIKQREDMKGVTFTPDLVAERGRSRSPKGRRRRRGWEDKEGEAEEEGDKQAQEGEGDTVFDRLAQARNRENGPVDSECTFQPKLQSSRETREAVVQDMSLQERLERYKSVKEARMAAKLKEKKAEEERACTFKPAIKPTRSKSRLRAAGYLGGPAEKADNEWAQLDGQGRSLSTTALLRAQIKATEERNKKIREDREMEGCTFHPRIIERPNRSKREGPVFARLLEAEEDRKSRLERMRRDKARQELEECSFQPSLAPTSGYRSPPRSVSPDARLSRKGKKAQIQSRRGQSHSPMRKDAKAARAGAGGSVPAAAGKAIRPVARKPILSAPHARAPVYGNSRERPQPAPYGKQMSTRRSYSPESLDNIERSGGCPMPPRRPAPPRRDSHGSSTSQDRDMPAAEPHGQPLDTLAEDGESLREEIYALTMSDVSMLDTASHSGGGGGGRKPPTSPRPVKSPRAFDPSSSMRSVNTTGSQILPSGERLRRFQEWRKGVESRIDFL